jgi:hypothetical protein
MIEQAHAADVVEGEAGSTATVTAPEKAPHEDFGAGVF